LSRVASNTHADKKSSLCALPGWVIILFMFVFYQNGWRSGEKWLVFSR
jgi:hypothetical protein